MSKFQIDDYVHVQFDILSEHHYAGHRQPNQGFVEAVHEGSKCTRYTISTDGQRWDAWEDELFLQAHPAAHLQGRLDL